MINNILYCLKQKEKQILPNLGPTQFGPQGSGYLSARGAIGSFKENIPCVSIWIIYLAAETPINATRLFSCLVKSEDVVYFEGKQLLLIS